VHCGCSIAQWISASKCVHFVRLICNNYITVHGVKNVKFFCYSFTFCPVGVHSRHAPHYALNLTSHHPYKSTPSSRHKKAPLYTLSGPFLFSPLFHGREEFRRALFEDAVATTASSPLSAIIPDSWNRPPVIYNNREAHLVLTILPLLQNVNNVLRQGVRTSGYGAARNVLILLYSSRCGP